ncbi:SixA phosphatase family protein [Sulfuriferula thiophila]|uniref:SixA phosphatase family protein n=1 Tax=Sulfuriferula thiophila TaxID=1781211 RepID=UPI00278C8522|nr:histidine phosphatase family protein [Sulfuriferula thiophila]
MHYIKRQPIPQPDNIILSHTHTIMADLGKTMDLILWRHADAVDGIPDMQRELTPKGIKQAQLMAGWLNSRLPEDTRVLVSPAIRAQQTVAALERPYTTDKAIAPEADAMALLLAAGWPDAGGTVLLVGHQPGFGRAAMLLLAGIETEMSIKKGGVVWISNRVRQTTQQNVLRVLMSPDMV